MFNGLGILHHLYLNNNFIKTIEIDAFQSLINLTVLNLAFNFIHSINKQTFAGLLKLHTPTDTVYLYLQNNVIRQIFNQTFAILNRLLVLDLSFNEITEIDEDSFKGLQNLRFLNLSSCEYIMAL
ncbi:keratocan-like [Mytilus galloprovincialis]|uniref:keratocan-like n=1 Tax=Mytilus galloprovincialis TaxID=29158 RepID=UPI003F7C3A97